MTKKTSTPPAESLYGSSTLPALIKIGDTDVQLGTIVAAAHTASGFSVKDWNELSEGDRDALLQAEVDERIAALPRPPGIHANVIEVEHARELRLAGTGEKVFAPSYAPGSIETFMDEGADGSRATMKVAVDADGALCKTLAT